MRALRNFFFWLHLAVGCTAGIVILVMSITGALLAFERQINQWFDTPAVRAHAGQAMPPSALIASVFQSGQGIPTQLVLRNNPAAPVEARFGRETTLFLDPGTAQILGKPSASVRGFFSATERIHRSVGLGMRSALGRGITGAANAMFLFLLLSGLYLWLPKSFTASHLKNRLTFRRGLTGRGRDWNWHNVIGIWCAFPLLFIVLSGVIMSYPWASNLLFRLTGSPPPSGFRSGPEGRGDGGGRSEFSQEELLRQYQPLDQALLKAEQKTSRWKSVTIDVPVSRDKTIHLSVDASIGGQPDRAMQLTLDRQTGEVISVKRFADNSVGSRLRAYARFVHTGEEFGIAGEAIAAAASLGGVMLVWTGLSMAIRRLNAKIKEARKTQETISRPAGV